MNIFDQIQKPTLLLDETTARANLSRMCNRVKQAGVRFRPHYKTHQSVEIGEWFRSEGVTAITVSSLEMASYFAANGWQDITLAFPINLRQMDIVNDLATRIRFGVLVESVDSIQYLSRHLKAALDVWIKIDTGSGRTGLAWDAVDNVAQLAAQIRPEEKMHLAGLLTHAGQSYHVSSTIDVCHVYQDSVNRINSTRDELISKGIAPLLVSVGDTPGASLCKAGRVDELRPGNFIFYDVQQLQIGSCQEEDIAVALVCPVVALHPDRNEIVVYGGAIHLSKEFIIEDGQMVYGHITFPEGNRWGKKVGGAYVRSLSQEHGIIRLRPEDMRRVSVGDLVCVLPVHSCLTANLMRDYMTLDGRRIITMNSR